MGLSETEHRKDEKINGVVYDMSLPHGYKHWIVNKTEISLKAFPYIKMTLGEIFEGVE